MRPLLKLQTIFFLYFSFKRFFLFSGKFFDGYVYLWGYPLFSVLGEEFDFTFRRSISFDLRDSVRPTNLLESRRYNHNPIPSQILEVLFVGISTMWNGA